MSEYVISNGIITVTADTHGGELKSVKKSQDEYMWDAQPEFWGRTAPVLFPFVGSVKDKKYHWNGVDYNMGQHGFARDMEMKVISKSDTSITFSLSDDAVTAACYPFHFKLDITYTLKNNCLNVNWNVTNEGTETMYFSIGGHPAFMCPLMNRGKQNEYAFRIMKNGEEINGFDCTPIVEGGLAGEKKTWYDTLNGILPITHELFINDALIIENNQADEVTLLDNNGKDYLTVKFKAPLFGLWSPAGKDAPFVCIEPWYGRCDGENFNGDLSKREWGNSLEAGQSFNGGFDIIL